MLLDYFHWDKEKLLERIYDGDQEKLFTEANIDNPFAKKKAPAKRANPKRGVRRARPDDEECCEVTLKLTLSYSLRFHL